MAVGIVLSGLIGSGKVQPTHPAAPWTSAESYARQFHWVQTLPFYAGFALVAGRYGDGGAVRGPPMMRNVRAPSPRSSRRRRSWR